MSHIPGRKRIQNPYLCIFGGNIVTIINLPPWGPPTIYPITQRHISTSLGVCATSDLDDGVHAQPVGVVTHILVVSVPGTRKQGRRVGRYTDMLMFRKIGRSTKCAEKHLGQSSIRDTGATCVPA